jgi:hypothetical protein
MATPACAVPSTATTLWVTEPPTPDGPSRADWMMPGLSLRWGPRPRAHRLTYQVPHHACACWFWSLRIHICICACVRARGVCCSGMRMSCACIHVGTLLYVHAYVVHVYLPPIYLKTHVLDYEHSDDKESLYDKNAPRKRKEAKVGRAIYLQSASGARDTECVHARHGVCARIIWERASKRERESERDSESGRAREGGRERKRACVCSLVRAHDREDRA